MVETGTNISMHGTSWWGWTYGAQYTCLSSCFWYLVQVVFQPGAFVPLTQMWAGTFFGSVYVGQLAKTSSSWPSAALEPWQIQQLLQHGSLWVFSSPPSGTKTLSPCSNGLGCAWSLGVSLIRSGLHTRRNVGTPQKEESLCLQLGLKLLNEGAVQLATIEGVAQVSIEHVKDTINSTDEYT